MIPAFPPAVLTSSPLHHFARNGFIILEMLENQFYENKNYYLNSNALSKFVFSGSTIIKEDEENL